MRRHPHSLALVLVLAGACRFDPSVGTFRDAALADATVADATPASFVVTAGGPGTDVARSIALDGAGNVFIAGSYSGTAQFGAHALSATHAHESFVAKLGPRGDFLWVRAIAGIGDDRPQSIAVDDKGNAYVATSFTGRSVLAGVIREATGPGDLLVVKLDPEGKAGWSAFASRGPLQLEDGMGLATDAAGQATITGSFQAQASFGPHTRTAVGGSDIFVARLDQTGSFDWLTTAGGAGTDHGNAVAVDGEGNAYLAGMFSGAAQFGAASFDVGQTRVYYHPELWRPLWACVVAWLDPAGAIRDARVLSLPLDSACAALARGAQGRLLVTGGHREAPDGALVPFVASVDTQGDQVVRTRLAPAGRGEGIARDPQGRLAVAGSAGADLFVARLDAAGEGAPVTAGGLGRAHAVAFDRSGAVFVAGSFSRSVSIGAETVSSVGGTDLFIWRLAP